MAAAAGIWNHMAAGQAPTGASASPMDSTTSGTGSTDSSSDSSTISANDFLTLLVTEMQNQDPTADTDPNEYINQLVQVNSLEQLIDINQNLSTALGDSTTSSGSSSTGQAAHSQASSSQTASSQAASSQAASSQTASAKTSAVSATTATNAAHSSPAAQHKAVALAAAKNALSSMASSGAGAVPGSAARHAPGNLSVPDAQPAAQKVAHALNGRSRPSHPRSQPRSISGSLPGAQ
ncbi:MAG: flagellar hook capping FlgD N-terminal domain-containing protein [Terracidiphilus sp.]